MPAPGTLHREIIGIVRVGRHVVGDPLDDLDPGGGQSGHFCRIVGQQPDAIDAQRAEHRRGVDIITLVVGKAQSLVGVDRVEPAVLQRLSAQFVGQADAAPFLA